MGRFRWFIAGSLVGLFACEKQNKAIDVQVFGHAGTGLENLTSPYHANSEEAINYALSIEGCDGVEVDVQVDGDGRLWLYHDEKLETTTDGSGCISNQSTEDLKGLRYTSVNQESLLQLSELNRLRLQGKSLFLDIRHFNYCSQQVVNIEYIINQLITLDFVHPEQFDTYAILLNPQWIKPFHEAGMEVLLHLTTMDNVLNAIELYPMLSGFVLKNKDFSQEEVSQIKDFNKKVYLFEMRAAKSIREALNKKPNGVITDDILTTIIEKY
jgi:glycerophosphoryl diester phosphodiesterase